MCGIAESECAVLPVFIVHLQPTIDSSTLILMVAIVLLHPSLIDVWSILSVLQPIVWLAALISSGVILRWAYKRTPIAYVRRQVRLLAFACVVAASGWACAITLPILLNNESLSGDQRFNLVGAVIPLAYLASGIGGSLYQLDRLLLRLLSHILTIVLLVASLSLILLQLGLQDISARLWAVVVGVALYRPIQYAIQLVLPGNQQRQNQQQALQETLRRLTTSLEAQTLCRYIAEGIEAMFGKPAQGIYLGRVDSSNTLKLISHERLPELPVLLNAGELTSLLATTTEPIDSRTLFARAAQSHLHPIEMQALQTPGVGQWCPIAHRDGFLLGLIVLGQRGDYDAYRTEDRRQLQQLQDAAALALANSAAYSAQLESEATVRQLYQHIQEVQDSIARNLARELHDEVINVSIRLNIQAIDHLRAQVNKPELQKEFELLIASERTVIQALRLICEQLHPTGIDDPFGLLSVLRMQIERIQSQWNIPCQLRVIGEPLPIASRRQREVLRITREALANAVKHAQPGKIDMELRYPANANDPIILTV